ncbi:MAG TPA: ParB/RepB/Spo0J family partition protein [Pirellulales bacterium]
MATAQVQEIPLGAIRWDKNIRSSIDESRVNIYASSLHIHGQLVPIRVCHAAHGYDGQDGMHRWLAAQKLGWTTLNAIIEERTLSEAEDIETQLVANSIRTDVSIPDRARNIAKLLRLSGHSAAEVARRLQLSETTITKLLTILKLPEAILEQVGAGLIGLNAAYEIAKVSDVERQAALANEVVQGRLQRDGVARTAKRLQKPGQLASAPAAKRAVVTLDNGRSITVTGEPLDFEGFISSCEAALVKAKKARAQALSFSTFLKVTRDQARG